MPGTSTKPRCGQEVARLLPALSLIFILTMSAVLWTGIILFYSSMARTGIVPLLRRYF
jgi:hypothetical protein